MNPSRLFQLLPYLLLACSILRAAGQPVIPLANLPTAIGDWARVLTVTSGVAAPALLGTAGGPGRWDFSGPKAAGESERRHEVVSPRDSGRGTRFAEATYAERVSYADSAAQSWSYYRFDATEGRYYYGFDDVYGDPGSPLVVFAQPTVDLPATLRFGDHWQRRVEFEDHMDVGFGELTIQVTFNSDASVDAWGTVVLPELGEVEALRINEQNTYDLVETSFGIPIGKQYVRDYYWIAPRLGEVARVISEISDSAPPPLAFARAKTVQRLLASSAAIAPPARVPVDGLTATRQGDKLFLSWSPATGTRSYVLESTSILAPAPRWTAFATNAANFVFLGLPKEAGRNFYRVFASP